VAGTNFSSDGGQTLEAEKERNCHCTVMITFSPRTFKSFSLNLTFSPLCNLPHFGVAFEVMHAFTLDGEINYAKSCGSLYPLRPFLIFLPLVTALKAALG